MMRKLFLALAFAFALPAIALAQSINSGNTGSIANGTGNVYFATASQSDILAKASAANAAGGGRVAIACGTIAMTQSPVLYNHVWYVGCDGWGPDNRITATASGGTILQATPTTIASGTYNTSTGAGVLTMSSPVGFSTGAGIALYSLTGTGGFATLNSATCAALNGPTATACNYIATVSNGGLTVSFTGPTGLGASTIAGGTLTFDGFDYHNADLGTPPVSQTTFIDGMLVGAGLENLSFTGFATPFKIGALYNPGAQSLHLKNIFTTASINWGGWCENCWSTVTEGRFVFNEGGIGAFAFVSSGQSTVFNPSNSSLPNVYAGIQNFTTRSVVAWSRSNSSLNKTIFDNLQPEHGFTTLVSQAATMANLSTTVTVTDGTKFPVGVTVFPDASVNGYVANQIYFVKTNNGANNLTLANTSYGSAIAATGNTAINLQTRGFPLFEAAAQDAASTLTAIEVRSPDFENSSTTHGLLVNCTGCRIEGGFVESGSVGKTFTLRGASNNHIDTTYSNYTVDADSASTTNTMLARGGASFPSVYFNIAGASGLVSSTADTKISSPVEGQFAITAAGVRELDFGVTNTGDWTFDGTALPTRAPASTWWGAQGNNAALLIAGNCGADKFAMCIYFDNNGPTYTDVLGAGHNGATNSFLRLGRAVGMGNAITDQATFIAETAVLNANPSATGSVPIGTTGTCSASGFVGGNTAGKFTAPLCAAGTIILTGLPTAANGYTCSAQDQTTNTDTLKQTANTTTSVTFLSTTANNDVIAFQCMGW